MRILVATPLFPPEIAGPAPYVKELVTRLAKEHEVTLLAYTHLPEGVPGVRIIVVDKHRALPLRLAHFLIALLRALRHADALLAVNGMAVELPLTLATLVSTRPVIVLRADPAATKRAQTERLPGLCARSARARARTCIESFPLSRPEIIPFEPYPSVAFAQYEQSWRDHLALIKETLSYAR